MPPADPATKRRNGFIGCGVIIAALVACTWWGSTLPDPPPEPTATPAPTVTATAAPSDTPEPTAPPTDSPDAPAVAIYASEVRRIFLQFVEPSTQMGALFDEATKSPALFVDDNWKLKMAVGLAFMSNAADELAATSGPPVTAAVGLKVNAIAAGVSEGCSLIAHGIDAIDSAQLAKGITKITDSAALIREVDADLTALENQAGLP